MELIIFFSIAAVCIHFIGEMAAYAAVHSDPDVYSYREYSRLNEWYTKKFFKRAWKARIQLDTAWLEHDMNVGLHKIFPEDCSFCKPKNAAQKYIDQVGKIEWAARAIEAPKVKPRDELEPRYDYHDHLLQFKNGLKLTPQTYDQLKQEGRLQEVVRMYDPNMLREVEILEPKCLTPEMDCMCANCDKPDFRAHYTVESDQGKILEYSA